MNKLISYILKNKMLRILSFFSQKDFCITAYQKKGMTNISVIPDMRIKHRLMWNKLLSSRAYSNYLQK